MTPTMPRRCHGSGDDPGDLFTSEDHEEKASSQRYKIHICSDRSPTTKACLMGREKKRAVRPVLELKGWRLSEREGVIVLSGNRDEKRMSSGGGREELGQRNRLCR